MMNVRGNMKLVADADYDRVMPYQKSENRMPIFAELGIQREVMAQFRIHRMEIHYRTSTRRRITGAAVARKLGSAGVRV